MKKAHSVDIHVGARLRAFRLQRGLSQAHLGAKVGVTFQQIQKYEKGTNRVSASKLFECAEILGMPITAFFEGVDPKDRTSEQPDNANRLDYEMLDLLRRIPESKAKREMKRLLQAMAS